MKKLIMLITLGLFIAPSILLAQDEEPEAELEKPKDAGIADFDAFKNKAFDIYEKSLKFKTMVENEEKFAAKDVLEVNKLQKDVREMKDTTEEMIKGAKKAKPLSKAGKAVKNTKAASEALKVGGENLKYVAENMVKADEEDGD